MMKKILWGSMLVLCTSACGNDPSSLRSGDVQNGPFASSSSAINQAEAEARATAILNGNVVSTELKIERGLQVFSVHLQLASGGLVEVKIDEASGQVVKVEAESGPFDFDLVPGADFLTLAEAMARATELHPGAALLSFELELDDSLRWKYELEVTAAGVAYEVELDAVTGAMLEDSVASEARDDSWDDNGGHGEEPGDDNGGHGDEAGDDNGGHGDDDNGGT